MTETISLNNIIQTISGLKIFAQNHLAARSLNKRYKQYYDNNKLYVFQEGEEGVFLVALKEYKQVLKIFKKYNIDP